MNNNEFRIETLLRGQYFGPSRQRMTSVVYDSRDVEEAAAFVCVTGEKVDGHVFIEDAIRLGASIIVGTNEPLLETYAAMYPSISFVCVNDSREALADLAKIVYDSPSEALVTIGVTGTNGKTTVSSFTYSLLNALSLRTGCIGTAGIWDDQKKTTFKQTVPTTPEAPDIHRVLAYFREREMKAAVIESTSIAIEQKRLIGLHFDVAVHTNLTPEHLEFHGTMEAYKEAKLKLFDQAKRAVVNIDDPLMAPDVINRFRGSLITYGTSGVGDLQAKDIQTSTNGTSFTLSAFEKNHQVDAPIVGDYNVANLLAAIATCYQIGFSIEEILSVVTSIKSPEGRFQIVENEAPYQIVLDYAHTPDALVNVLEAVRDVPYRKLIVMITGIGLRDPAKRPLMAQVVDGMADEIVVSVDQPGHTNRQEVVDDVLKGFKNPSAPHIHSRLHREEGIHHAFDLAEPGDVVLLTGIGFGGYQIIGDERVPYSELAVIDDYFENGSMDLAQIKEPC